MSEDQSGFTPEEEVAEYKLQLEAQKRRYEKLKFKHSYPNELRQNFQMSLSKLNSLDTRDVAIKELRHLIEKNNTMEALKIFLTCLGDAKKIKSPGAREQEVLILGFISFVFAERISEDNWKNVIRMLEIIREFFGDLSRAVHEAAATAFCEVYEHCSQKGTTQEILTIFFDPLETVMTSGLNLKAQQAASLSIFKFLQILIQTSNMPLLQACYPKVISLYTKLRTDFPDLISALGILIESLSISLSEIHPILKKTIQYLQITGIGAHLCRTEACKFLSCIAKQLKNSADYVIEAFYTEIIYLLQQTAADKLQSVQNAARNALQDWKLLKILSKESEKTGFKYNRTASPTLIGPNNFKTKQELAKRNKKDWGLTSPKFLEKNSGNYSVSPSQSQELRKSKAAFSPKSGFRELKHPKNKDSSPLGGDVGVVKTGQQENLNSISSKIQESFKAMENLMDASFGKIEKKLSGLDFRVDSAYGRLESVEIESSAQGFDRINRENAKKNRKMKNTLSQGSLGVGQSGRALDALSQIWVEVLAFVSCGKIEQAFRRVLQSGDDIYLLRLLHKTGVCLKGLSQETCREVLMRLGLILNSNFLENLGMGWIDDAIRGGVFEGLEMEEKESVVEILRRYGEMGGEEGEKAEEVLRNLRY